MHMSLGNDFHCDPLTCSSCASCSTLLLRSACRSCSFSCSTCLWLCTTVTNRLLFAIFSVGGDSHSTVCRHLMPRHHSHKEASGFMVRNTFGHRTAAETLHHPRVHDESKLDVSLSIYSLLVKALVDKLKQGWITGGC